MSAIFGPVPSRRLGLSLGIDLVPYKTCPYDCIYCQLGRSTRITVIRESFTPISTILNELNETLRKGCHPDYITLSGSGEPTLFAELGSLIADIKECTDIPIAVLTNGALLWDDAVRRDLCQANLIIPSLDAGDSELFQCINRPHPDISFDVMIEGLVALRRDFPGQIWLEVMLLAGLTSSQAEVEKIRVHIARIRPDRIQLNTVVRPPACDIALPVTTDQLALFADQLGLQAEIICDYTGSHESAAATNSRTDIVELLSRRPCSLEDISQGLSMHPNEVIKHLDYLMSMGYLELTTHFGKHYYSLVNASLW